MLSRMNSPPSCRASWMKRHSADGHGYSAHQCARARPHAPPCHGRDQCHASVDVMLVLLIVFMVTAPLLTVGVPVDLPKTKAPALGQDREPLSVTIAKDGKIFLQKEVVT